MGTALDMARELSFQDQLTTIVDSDSEGSYTEAAQDAMENSDRRSYQTHSEFQGTPDNPYRVELRTTQRVPHRPEVDEAVIERLHQAVKREKSSVPVEKFDFDDNLSIVLNGAERYYRALQCEIVETTNTVTIEDQLTG
jgi:hypothetical protein